MNLRIFRRKPSPRVSTIVENMSLFHALRLHQIERQANAIRFPARVVNAERRADVIRS